MPPIMPKPEKIVRRNDGRNGTLGFRLRARVEDFRFLGMLFEA
jgi:hypothetical protein